MDLKIIIRLLLLLLFLAVFSCHPMIKYQTVKSNEDFMSIKIKDFLALRSGNIFYSNFSVDFINLSHNSIYIDSLTSNVVSITNKKVVCYSFTSISDKIIEADEKKTIHFNFKMNDSTLIKEYFSRDFKNSHRLEVNFGLAMNQKHIVKKVSFRPR